MLPRLTHQLALGIPLNDADVAAAAEALTDESVPTDHKASFLTALARKGETPDELSLFAAELRRRAVALPLPDETRRQGILDVVGTGGDRAGTVNISSAAALVAAAAGVPVAKHGNRAVTSKSGSADVLRALGIPTELPPEQASEALRRHGFVFLFAPLYHPAFRAIAPARKLCAEKNQRTIFNLLGPLLNPARPDMQLMGVAAPHWCEPLARALALLGVRRSWVVCGEAGVASDGSPVYLDEVSPLGITTVGRSAPGESLTVESLHASDLPVGRGTLKDLQGGDATANAAQIRRIFRGEERGLQRDAVLLNAAAALVVAGHAPSIHEGWARAAAVVDGGDALRKLEDLATSSSG